MLALKHIGAKEFRKSIDINEGIQIGLLGHADSRATVGRLGGVGRGVGMALAFSKSAEQRKKLTYPMELDEGRQVLC